MLEFNADFSVNLHFEITEEYALEKGGIDYSQIKQSINELPDWILKAIIDYVSFGENDSVSVIPYEQHLILDGKEIIIDDIDIESNNTEENDDSDDEVVEEDINEDEI